MRKFFAFLLALCLCMSASADFVPPKPVEDPLAVAENARELIVLLCSCPSLSSFDGTAPALLASEAAALLPEGMHVEDVFVSFEDVYDVFVAPCVGDISFDSVIDTGLGTVRASVSVFRDEGYGLEFTFSADFILCPDENAPYGALLERIFIPE